MTTNQLDNTKSHVIVLMKFGSHLYGTDTPNSDIDYKGIFMPSLSDLLLNRVSKSCSITTKQDNGKNTSKDIDQEIYSLHYFIQLACEGQTVALDMLHAPSNMIIQSSPLWDAIVARRDKFYTKNLHAFVGYARRQAAKYGIKGSRLNSARKFLDLIACVASPDAKLYQIWDLIEKHVLDENIHFIENDKAPVRQVQVCGKILQETYTLRYAYDVIKKFYDSYGSRVEQAANNQGIDWKAVSHAVRAAYQVKELLTDRRITFPLKEAEYIKLVKSGKLDYMTDVAPKLELAMSELEILAEKSELPEKVDREYWDKFIELQIREYYGISNTYIA